jgi:hypothetical protein
MKIFTGLVPGIVWASNGVVSDREAVREARSRVGFSDMDFMRIGLTAECWGLKSFSLILEGKVNLQVDTERTGNERILNAWLFEK